MNSLKKLLGRDQPAGTVTALLGKEPGNLDFFARCENRIAKLAVIGEPRWKDETLLFLGAGRRTGATRYYGYSQESVARAWLADASA